jgi:hypothetical protein
MNNTTKKETNMLITQTDKIQFGDFINHINDCNDDAEWVFDYAAPGHFFNTDDDALFNQAYDYAKMHGLIINGERRVA